jgi:hypothetical protein
LIDPVPLRHYCASARFYSVPEDGLIAPSLEAVLLGPHPPLLIAAATPPVFRSISATRNVNVSQKIPDLRDPGPGTRKCGILLNGALKEIERSPQILLAAFV